MDNPGKNKPKDYQDCKVAQSVLSVENIVWQLREDSHGLTTFPRGSFWDTAKYFGGVTATAWEAEGRVTGFFFKEDQSLIYWNILATVFGKGGLTSGKDSKWKRLGLLVPKEFDVDWRPGKQGEPGKLKRMVPAWGRPDDRVATHSEEKLLMIKAIKAAIEDGAPAFNKGDKEGCKATYLKVCAKYANEDSQLRDAAKDAKAEDAEKGAWTLRHAKDAVPHPSALRRNRDGTSTYDEFNVDEARELIERWKFDIASQQYYPTDVHRAKLKRRIEGARDNEIPVEDRAEAYRLGVRDLRRIVLLEHVIITGFTDDDDEFGQGANCCTPPADTGKREHKYNLTKQKQADNERLVVLPPFFTYRQWFACYCARDPAWSLL